jgi:hypothetical protein
MTPPSAVVSAALSVLVLLLSGCYPPRLPRPTPAPLPAGNVAVVVVSRQGPKSLLDDYVGGTLDELRTLTCRPPSGSGHYQCWPDAHPGRGTLLLAISQEPKCASLQSFSARTQGAHLLVTAQRVTYDCGGAGTMAFPPMILLSVPQADLPPSLLAGLPRALSNVEDPIQVKEVLGN